MGGADEYGEKWGRGSMCAGQWVNAFQEQHTSAQQEDPDLTAVTSSIAASSSGIKENHLRRFMEEVQDWPN